MFSSVANKYWPGISWHGESNIHVSVCWNAALPLGNDKVPEILSLLEKNHVGSSIYRKLVKMFPNLVWIISAEEFEAVFMVDCHNHLLGEADSRSPDKIKNPHTGNYFHRVALIDDIVCGVRFWCDSYGPGETLLGFRFRITKQDEDEETTRDRTRAEAIEAVEEMEKVMDLIADVAEPSHNVTAKVEQMLMTLADD